MPVALLDTAVDHQTRAPTLRRASIQELSTTQRCCLAAFCPDLRCPMPKEGNPMKQLPIWARSHRLSLHAPPHHRKETLLLHVRHPHTTRKKGSPCPILPKTSHR